MKKLIFIICFLMWAGLANAATYYVNNVGGDNTRNTTQAQVISTPWATIQKCADNTVAGDTCVVIASGTPYNEVVTEGTNGTSGNLITYVSRPHGAVVRGFNFASRSYTRIIGFEVTHLSNETASINVAGGSYNQILYNYVHHVNGGINLGSTTTTYNIVRGNIVEFVGCPASGPCMTSAAVTLKGAKNLFEYNSFAHISDYFPISATAATNGYNIMRNNYLGHCYFSDAPDNTHTDGNAECTGVGTASDHTGSYSASCCTGSKTGTCTARHIDSIQNNTLSNYILFEKNYHDYGSDSDVTDRHGILARLANATGMKLRENFSNYVTTSWYSGGSGFRMYNNTILNGRSYLVYGYLYAATNGKGFNNIFSNPSLVSSTRPYYLYTSPSGSELVADYDIWYNYSTYSLGGTPATWSGGSRAAITATATDPKLETNFVLKSDSPAKGAGISLTLANGAGDTTTTLVVDDAQPFVGQDWGVLEASGSAYGDTIIIGTNDPVKITAINYAENTITIASAQSWADNAAIRLSHQSAAMDIGAYPYKASYALTGTWALSEGTVTVTPSDASLVRFVEVLENGIPVGVDYTSPYTVSGVGEGTVTVKMFRMFASNDPIVAATQSGDSTAPTLAEVTPVTTPSQNMNPSYVFSSDEAGSITYGGTCGTGSLANAIAGNNTVTWTLAVGTYSNCTITVNDGANSSDPLAVTEFVIQEEPNYTLTVTKTGTGCKVVTSPTSDIDCGSTCSAVLGSGTTTQLFVVSDPGWQDAVIGGDCASDGTVTMSSAKTCTAVCKEKKVLNCSR